MSKSHKAIIAAVILIAVPLVMGGTNFDQPPHNDANGVGCLKCHSIHHAVGPQLTKAKENANLCMSCHTTGGQASAKPFLDADQALPGVTGESHRWASGVGGHAEVVTIANGSTGEVASGGVYTGNVNKDYTITIASDGDAGAALFSWQDSQGNSASNVLTGTDISLNDGVTVTFTDATAPSFKANDQWKVYVLADLRAPVTVAMSNKIMDGKVVCSACHNPHNHNSGNPFLRASNTANAMCKDCHNARDVTDADNGSHPVGVTIPGTGYYQSPPNLNLDSSNVECTTCHSPHNATSGGANGGSGDGYLLDLSMGSICGDCHTWPTSTAAHLSSTIGALWPGGQYGSSFAARSASERGKCQNCHWPHGVPDDNPTTQKYPSTGVEENWRSGVQNSEEEDLCYTCHDGDPESDKKTELSYAPSGVISHHKVEDDTVGGVDWSIECTDCHNVHLAREQSSTGRAASDPDDINTLFYFPNSAYTTKTTAYNAFCLRCHDGNAPSGVIGAIDVLAELDDPNTVNTGFKWKGGAKSLHGEHNSNGFGCQNCHGVHGTQGNGVFGDGVQRGRLLFTWITVKDDVISNNGYVNKGSCSTSPTGYRCHHGM